MSELKQMIESNRPPSTREEIQKIIEAWLATPEGKSFYPSDYNLMVLTESMSYDTSPMCVAKISRHYWKRRGQGVKFTRAEEAERVAKAKAQAAADSDESKRREAQRIYNLPENVQARADAARAEASRIEKEILASFWKPAFPAEDSHSILIRATRETENYQRRKLGFPERS